MSNDTYLKKLVDDTALKSYLEDELGKRGDGTYNVERHQAGHSNETLFVEWGDRELVLRRPPPGETADTAHDVLREYTIINKLQETAVRVPKTVLSSTDHSILGSDFYIMEKIDGEVIRDSEPERFATPDARKKISDELVDQLVKIHQTDLKATGLDDMGRPDGYTRRQVDRWIAQYDWAMEVTENERSLEHLEPVANWLEENCPETYPHTLVHGDYKPDNVMFGPGDSPEIVGVFDWELATVGDPRFDLGWLLAYWRDPSDPPRAIPELVSDFSEKEGYRTRQELVDRYETAAGITFDHERFYRALSVFKLGALGEMFFRRHLEGNASNDLYPKMRERVPSILERATRIIDGEEPL